MSFGSRRAMTNSSRSPFTVVTSQQYPTFSVSLSFVVFCHPILFNFTTRIGNWRDENQGLYLTAICHRIHVAPVRGEKSPAQSCNANHEAQYERELCTHLNIFFGWFFFLLFQRDLIQRSDLFVTFTPCRYDFYIFAVWSLLRGSTSTSIYTLTQPDFRNSCRIYANLIFFVCLVHTFASLRTWKPNERRIQVSWSLHHRKAPRLLHIDFEFSKM